MFIHVHELRQSIEVTSEMELLAFLRWLRLHNARRAA